MFFFTSSIYANNEKTDKNWEATILKSIAKNQYNFSSNNPLEKVALNKASSFRAKISPLKQSFQDTDGSSAFEYDLILTQIKKGDYYSNLSDKPSYVLNKEKMTENHSDFFIEYLNNEKGLKQNFILPTKIQSSNKLVISLKFDSENCEVSIKKNEIVILKKGDSNVIAKYSELLVYDANKTLVPSKFNLHANNIVIEVDDRNAIYPLTVDPLSTTPSTQIIFTQAQAQFGYSVSTAGDVNGDGFTDVIVGAPKFDNPLVNEGAAYVYYGSANGVAAVPAWSSEGNFTGANFGVSVSEAGDVNGDGFGDIIVGAELYDNGVIEIDEGKIFVFHGSAAGLSLGPDWTYESNQAGANLGFIVSTAGDVNNDGFSDIIAGAPTYSNGTNKEGIAVVFHGSGTGLNAVPATTLEINVDSALFGWSVSCAGDVNGDSFDDVIVSGAFYDDNIVTKHEGIAKVYHGSAVGVNPVAAWSVEGNQTKCYFGESVSWAGDLNGDGYGDVVVGSDYWDSGSNLQEGAAFVYHGSAVGLSGVATITLESNINGAYFGVGVNGAGDVNGDGYGDLVIGAYGFTSPSANEGATYVYYGTSTGVTAALFTRIESNVANTEAGVSVCSAGDVNGDGFSDVISGAYLFDKTSIPTATNAGCIYVFNGLAEGIGTAPIPSSPFTLAEASAGLGNFVTTIGDVNGDGFSDIAVGASLADNGGTNRGLVYIFNGSSTGYSAVPNVTLSGPAINASQFGCSIGSAGDVNGDGYSDLIVGASNYINGQANEGLFRIYLGSAAGINPVFHLSVESNVVGAQLGYSVAGAGDVNGDGYSDVVVGGNQYNSGTVDEGKIFVYYGSATGVDGIADWSYETNIAEKLGACVAGVGDVNGDGYSDVVALSSNWSNGQTNEGRMYYFRGSATGLELLPGTVYETNVASAGLDRNSTSYMGDLNGDGFNDVVIGVSSFNSGATVNEGELIIMFGATPSLYFGFSQIIEGNAAGFQLGATVGFGGDVNGDGYNDIATGSPNFTNGQAAEGIARVYRGGPGFTLPIAPYFAMESNLANVSFGSSISSTGDGNGDGFSDLMIGANNYDLGIAPLNVGRVTIFMGGNSHAVLPKTFMTRQYKSDLTTAVQSSNGTFEIGCTFGLKHTAKHHLGKGRGKQAYEFKGHPSPFNNFSSAIANSVTFSGQEAAFTDLGLTGNTMSPLLTAPGLGFPKWRTRTKFNVIDAIDGQMHGRWFYGGIHDKQDRSIKISVTCGVLPVELASLETTCLNGKSTLNFSVLSQENIAQYIILGSVDGITYEEIKVFHPELSSNYEINIPANIGYEYVRLEIIDNNNNIEAFDRKLLRCIHENSALSLFPNPTSTSLNLRLTLVDEDEIIENFQIVDLSGRIILSFNKYVGEVDVSFLPVGIYYVSATSTSGKKFSSRFSHL